MYSTVPQKEKVFLSSKDSLLNPKSIYNVAHGNRESSYTIVAKRIVFSDEFMIATAIEINRRYVMISKDTN